MATVSNRQQYSRAADKIEGIGDNLDKIEGRDMLLHNFAISERSMRGDDKTFVGLTLSEIATPDEVKSYHAWSESLAEKVAQLDKDELPMIVAFQRVTTAGGFRVWTIV
jgi:hypothetical protein